MKFTLSNKEEILAELAAIESDMKNLRFRLTHLPEEFEFTAEVSSNASTADDRPAQHN